jgi:hypothetical protein
MGQVWGPPVRLPRTVASQHKPPRRLLGGAGDADQDTIDRGPGFLANQLQQVLVLASWC